MPGRAFRLLALALLALVAVPLQARAAVQRGSYSYSRSGGQTAVVRQGQTVVTVPLRTTPAQWTSRPGSQPATPSAPPATTPSPPSGGPEGSEIARVAVPAAPAPLAPQPSAPGLTADERRLVDLVNRARAANGLPPLAVDPRLVETARRKSRDMVEKGYFNHRSPTYGWPWEMWRAAGVAFWTGGENLAGAPSVDLAFRNLMNSSGHRANILNRYFTHLGVGVVDGGPYGKMITQHFVAAH